MKTVLILMDSLNRHHLRCYNPDSITNTPSLDRFAGESAVFDNHFIGSAPCMPARRDIMTGRLNFLERTWGGIEPFDVTLPACLRERGVFCHMTTDHTHYFEIGGENYPYLFNTWDYHRGQEFDPWVSRVDQPPVDPEGYGRKSSQYLLNRIRFKTDADYPTPRTFASACRWLEDNQQADDFFLLVETFDPHEPFDTPEEFFKPYGDGYGGPEFYWSSYAPVSEPAEAVRHLGNRYRATLSMADKWLGKLLHTLRETGRYEDTLIILTTDHGHQLGEHGFTGKNQSHAYNELAHIPLMVRLPGGEGAGARVKALSQNIDLMPTILQQHGCPVPGMVLGNSLSDMVRGAAPRRESVLYGWFGRAVNVTDGTHTYFRAPANPDNQPLSVYTAMPSTVWRYYGPEYAQDMETGRFLPYTDYPVYRIKPIPGRDEYMDLEHVRDSVIYNIAEDPGQVRPVRDGALEQELCEKLVRCMERMQAPQGQYARLGLRGN